MIQKRDVLDEVEIYLSYGKNKEAVSLLQEGIRKDSSRADLKKKLHEIIETELVRVSGNSKYIYVHGFVFYMLFVISMLFVAYIISIFANLVDFSVYLPNSFAILFTICIVSAVLFAIASIFVFCFVWFQYIKLSSANKYLSEIESKLHIYKFEPIYGFVKNRVHQKNT